MGTTGSEISSGEDPYLKMLMFSMPLYEAKYHEEDVWQEISELKLMDELYKTFKKVTPAIKEMINGKEVKTPHGIYRLKLKGGDEGGQKPQFSKKYQKHNLPDQPN